GGVAATRFGPLIPAAISQATPRPISRSPTLKTVGNGNGGASRNRSVSQSRRVWLSIRTLFDGDWPDAIAASAAAPRARESNVPSTGIRPPLARMAARLLTAPIATHGMPATRIFRPSQATAMTLDNTYRK